MSLAHALNFATGELVAEELHLARVSAHVEQLLEDERVLEDDIDHEVYRSPTRSERAQTMMKEANRLYYEINDLQKEVEDTKKEVASWKAHVKKLSAQADAAAAEEAAALGQLRTIIEAWEGSWVEMLHGQNNPERAEMVAEIRKIGELHAGGEISRWIQAFESSLVEQAKYEAWYEKLSTSGRDEALQERATALQAYRDNGQLHMAPDWLFPHFNPRHGPAHSLSIDN
jgi:hypothetical protein